MLLTDESPATRKLILVALFRTGVSLFSGSQERRCCETHQAGLSVSRLLKGLI